MSGWKTLWKARSAGKVSLPESPQHRVWRHPHGGGRPDRGIPEALRASVVELGGLLDAGQAPSDVWFEFGKRLSAECRRLGSATYCLASRQSLTTRVLNVDKVLGRRNVWDWGRR
jgi:hypothetical protein